MFKTYYKYGVMNSSKTASLLMAAHNYQDKHQPTFFITPQQDTRADHLIKARIGLSQKPDLVLTDFNHDLKVLLNSAVAIGAIVFVDECQFVPYDLVKQMVNYCHECEYNNNLSSDACLMAYGLLKDFNNHLFDGSRAWLEEADSIHEIKTVCHYCNHKATVNYLKGSNPNSNIHIGDQEYLPVCSRCYYALQRGDRPE